MRYYLYAVALTWLWPCLAVAQAPVAADSMREDTTVYPVAPDERWVWSTVDSTGECTEMLHWEGRGGLVRVYHASGQLKQYVPYADFAAGSLHGVSTMWYANGQIAVYQAFVRGRRAGELRLYYPSGQLKRQTSYENGIELVGDCFDETGTRLPYFPYEQPPLYPGGSLQLTKEISRFLHRVQLPGPVRLSKAQVHVRFQVSENGNVANPQITLTEEKFSIVSSSMNNNAVWQTMQQQTTALLASQIKQALAQLSKSFYPGQRDGATVNWQYSLTIPFYMEGPIPRWGTIRYPDASFGL